MRTKSIKVLCWVIISLIIISLIIYIITPPYINELILTKYTVLSNIFVLVSIIIVAYKKSDTSYLLSQTTVIISMTFFASFPLIKTADASNMILNLAQLLLHYIVPTLVFVVNIISLPKQTYKWYYPFLYIIAPGIYFSTIMILGTFVSNSIYPYYFLNPTIIGWTNVFLYTTGIVFIYLIVGFSLYAMNKITLKNGIQNSYYNSNSLD